MSTETDAPAQPDVRQYGRYKLSATPDGQGMLARAVNTCESCQSCGCGDQQELVPMPGVLLKILTGQPVEKAEVMGLLMQGGFLNMMKGLMGRG